ncbi:hypothetical protein EJB05_12955, partial [Eragrostis curvula]
MLPGFPSLASTSSGKIMLLLGWARWWRWMWPGSWENLGNGWILYDLGMSVRQRKAMQHRAQFMLFLSWKGILKMDCKSKLFVIIALILHMRSGEEDGGRAWDWRVHGDYSRLCKICNWKTDHYTTMLRVDQDE